MAELLYNRSEELADMLRPILHLLQILIKEFTLDDLKSILSKLEDFAATQRALPFPETQNKADLNEKKNKLFEAIIKLAERQQDVLDHKDQFVDSEFLKKLGLI